MKSRNLLLSLTAAATLGLPALASAQVFVDVDREAGFILQIPAPTAATKADRAIQQPAAAPTGAGWRETRGNAGWVYVGHQYALRDGKWVCVDGIDHSVRADFSPLDKSLHSGS